jgi:hypothetical protein
MNPSKPLHCQEELRVIKSARTGFWDLDLEQHVADCPVCSEVAFTARLLNQMRATDEVESRIPDSGLMWWKAQLLAKREAGEKATQPINLIERFACAWAAVCVIGVCVWQWHAIRGWLVSFANGGRKWSDASVSGFFYYFSRVLGPTALETSLSSGSGLLIVAGAGILLLFVAFAAYFAHSEE